MILKIFLLSCAVPLVVCPISASVTSWQKAAWRAAPDVAECPIITLDCPIDFSQDEPRTFTANVSGIDKDHKLNYRWTVGQGKITKGQGTSSIRVEGITDGDKGLTVTVAVEGLPENCANNTAACAISHV